MAYAPQILGDDYTGFGDKEQHAADHLFVAAALRKAKADGVRLCVYSSNDHYMQKYLKGIADKIERGEA